MHVPIGHAHPNPLSDDELQTGLDSTIRSSRKSHHLETNPEPMDPRATVLFACVVLWIVWQQRDVRQKRRLDAVKKLLDEIRDRIEGSPTVEHELEAILAFLDAQRGSSAMKKYRRQLVEEAQALLKRFDETRGHKNRMSRFRRRRSPTRGRT